MWLAHDILWFSGSKSLIHRMSLATMEWSDGSLVFRRRRIHADCRRLSRGSDRRGDRATVVCDRYDVRGPLSSRRSSAQPRRWRSSRAFTAGFDVATGQVCVGARRTEDDFARFRPVRAAQTRSGLAVPTPARAPHQGDMPLAKNTLGEASKGLGTSGHLCFKSRRTFLDRPSETLLIGPCGAADELPIHSGRSGRQLTN